MLGYLGEATEAEIAPAGGALPAGDLVGKKGIEQTYDAMLRGSDGERVVVVDSRGRAARGVRPRERAEPGKQPAASPSTSSCSRRRRAGSTARRRSARWWRWTRATARSWPWSRRRRYNPNLFARRLRRRASGRRCSSDPNHPLQNRAIQNTYSPGSVFKIVMATAGLTEGRGQRSDTGVFCGGAAVFYGRRFRCWKQRRPRLGRRCTRALKHSCDVYFYTLGQRLGIERIAQLRAAVRARRRRPASTSPARRRGWCPIAEWSQRVRKHQWYPGETISVVDRPGAGAGDAAADGGDDGDRRQRRPPGDAAPGRRSAGGRAPARVPLDADALWRSVRERAVGGGQRAGRHRPRSARVAGLEIAGKTGTVQVIAQATRTDSQDPAVQAPRPRLVRLVRAGRASAAGGGGVRRARRHGLARRRRRIAKALYEKYFRADLDVPAAP